MPLMAHTTRGLHALRWWALGADDPVARREWQRLGVQALCTFRSSGVLVRTAWEDPLLADRALSVLAGVNEPLAAQTALAILSPPLGQAMAAWARAGVPEGDRDDLEAELVAEALTSLRLLGQAASVDRVVSRARWAARDRRRPHLATVGRRAELSELAGRPSAARARTAADRAGRLVIEAARCGRISVPVARAVWATGVAGWSTAEASSRLGCDPAAVRARRARGIRALAG